MLTIERRSHSDGPILVRLKAEQKKNTNGELQAVRALSPIAAPWQLRLSHCRPPPPHNPQNRPTRAHTSSGVIEHPPRAAPPPRCTFRSTRPSLYKCPPFCFLDARAARGGSNRRTDRCCVGRCKSDKMHYRRRRRLSCPAACSQLSVGTTRMALSSSRAS